MTMSTLAHRATAPVPARRVQVCAVASPPPGTGRFFSSAALRRTASYSAVLGLVAGLQIVSAGPASVASLANRAAPQTEAKFSARIEPAVESSAPAVTSPEAAPAEPAAPALDGALFSAILNDALPALQRIEPQTTGGISRESPDDILTFGTKRAPRWLVETILKASYKTGIDPIYMMTLADVESSLSPVAKAPTSSAEGLFQFIDRTWLEILYMHGAEHGFGAAAAAIRMVDDEPVVSDRDRSWILGLKRDPYLSALMAGELIRDIRRELQAQGERELSEAELYLAHFFGASSAVRFLAALDETPDQSAAKLFPKAAKANLGLFTEKNGRKRRSITVAELYDRIDGKIVRRLNSFDTVARQERQPVRLEALAEPTTR
jgi:soluble lytic murein transglycosylase-like protein